MTLTKTFDTHIKAISTEQEWDEYKAMVEQPSVYDLLIDKIRAVGKPKLLTQNNKAMKYRVTTDSFEGIEKGTVVESSTEVHGIAYFPGDNKWYANEHYINAHNQYFEPVEQVTEGQYWKWKDDNEVVRIESVRNGSAFYKPIKYDNMQFSGKDYLVANARKLSTDEIEQALIKEAKRRGYEAGNFCCLRDGYIWDYKKWGYKYYPINDELALEAGTVYKQGEWAEIVDEKPYIEVNGYEAEFKDGYVMIGCKRIENQTILDLQDLVSSGDVEVTIQTGKHQRRIIHNDIEELAHYIEENK